MNDITALMQKIKAAAITVARDGRTDDEWFYYLQCVHHKNVLALVEALEASDAEFKNSVRRESADRNKIDEQAKRIDELEESHAQVIQARDHYKRMAEEGLKGLQESRTVTVKLPELPVLGSNAEWYQGYAAGTSSMRKDCAIALRAAGIQVIEREGQYGGNCE